MNKVTLNDIFIQLEEIKILLTKMTETKKRKVQAKFDGLEMGPTKLVEIWNEWRSLKFSKVIDISVNSTRYKNAATRWMERPSEEYWISVIKKLNESMFCHGDNNRGWVADFEFLVRPDVHNRILEGKYDKCHLSYVKETKKSERVVGKLLDGTPVLAFDK